MKGGLHESADRSGSRKNVADARNKCHYIHIKHINLHRRMQQYLHGKV